MKSVGTYCNGDPCLVNPVAGTGVNFTSITPASANVSGRVIDGTMLNYGEGGIGYAPTLDQGFDSIEPGMSTPWASYDAALNLDPGKTGVPIHFAPGAEGTLLKAVSNPTPAGGVYANRDRIDFIGIMTVCAVAPPANAFRPGVSAPSKISHWIEDDMDLDLLRNLTLPTSAPDPAAVLSSYMRWPAQTSECGAAPGRSVCGNFNHPQYGANHAQQIGTSFLLMNGAIDATVKLNLSKANVQRGIDAFERLKQGGDYSAGGGGHSSMKSYLVIAAHLLGDAEMQEWCDKSLHDVFIEGYQYGLISAAHVANDGFPAEALGGPEWFINPRSTPGHPEEGASYRGVNFRWQPGVALGLTLMGARPTWNDPPFFDYVDRMMVRRFFPTSGTTALALAATGTNSTPQFHDDMWAAHRTAAGMPAIWDWP